MGIGAITTGIIGIKKSPAGGGKGMAVTGLILGILAILASIALMVLLFIFGFAMEMNQQQDYLEMFQDL